MTTTLGPAAPARRSPDRVWTVPNALSALRLLAVPVFVWLVLGPRAYGAAFGLLAASSATDYLDGYIARRFDAGSRLGELLDPLADRLYVVATVVTLTVRGFLPVWVPAVLLVREAVLAGLLPVLRRHGYGPLPVHIVGKAGTLCLLYGFPLLLLTGSPGTLRDVVRPVAWAFVLWGCALYWWAGGLYGLQVRRLVAQDAAASGARA